MVASSPVRHESNLQANPVEVQSYQPPWKALSEFAMQSDLDQPPFQQLVSAFPPPPPAAPPGLHAAGGGVLQAACSSDDDVDSDAVVFA